MKNHDVDPHRDRWVTFLDLQVRAGLLVTGNVGVDPDHPVRPGDVILREGTPLAPFERWAAVAKKHGARIVMQLNHAGRQTPGLFNPRPIGPSTGAAVKTLRAFGKPRAATEIELADVIQRHSDAARLAERAGFDGVQVHAAHGYLINQFLAPDVNTRADGWGGPVTHRARLLLACVRAVRAATSDRFAVLVKLNAGDFLAGGFTEDEALEVVSLLARERIDLLEISGGRYESGASFGHATPNVGPREAYFLEFARRARKAIDVPIMLTGGLRSREAMDEALREGSLDLVGIARPMTLVPDYPKRVLGSGGVASAPSPSSTSAPKIGIGVLAPLEGPAELAWYYAQLSRLAEGKEPRGRLSSLSALVWFLVVDTVLALRVRRATVRPRLTSA